MALKPRPKLKGIPLGSSHRVDAKAGKVVPIKKKLSPPAEYARAKRQKWKAAK